MKTLAPLLLCALAAPALAAAPKGVAVPLAADRAGIGFDDLGYAPGLGRVLAPGGRTGRLFLIDPASRRFAAVSGFSVVKGWSGGHDDSVTSADEGAGFLFATDRTARTLAVVDPKSRRVVASVALGAGPDYARWVEPTREVWVSEPDSEQIEVFSFAAKPAPALVRAAAIPVPGGPESLVIDAARGRAYAHLWKGATVAVGLRSRRIEATWPNGCEGSRGIALDAARGWVFAGCAEGKASVLDAAKDGRILSTVSAGAGIDVIAYDAKAGRLYLPGAKSATLAFVSVAADGALKVTATAPTAKGAHCVAADGRGGVWVCDPAGGRLLYFRSPR